MCPTCKNTGVVFKKHCDEKKSTYEGKVIMFEYAYRCNCNMGMLKHPKLHKYLETRRIPNYRERY